MIYLLDSSALVAHALRLAGAEQVQSLLDDEAHEITLSSLSLFELAGCLKLHGAAASIPKVLASLPCCSFRNTLDGRQFGGGGVALRESVGQRIPITDAIIAASAQRRGATLVHRDQHLASIPATTIPQLILLSGISCMLLHAVSSSPAWIIKIRLPIKPAR